MIKAIKKTCAFLCLFGVFTGSVHADTKVNGVNISEDLIQARANLILKDGKVKDGPELKAGLKEDQINREVLMQEIAKSGLDKAPEAKLQLDLARQNTLIDFYFRDYFAKNPVAEAEIRNQYDSDLKAITAKSTDQYKLKLIVVKTKTDADAVIAKLKKESFETVAKSDSVDATRINGGDLGWVLPAQVLPEVGDTMMKIGKEGLSTPIQLKDTWAIIKVEGKRQFMPLSLEELRPKIIQGLVIKKRNQVIAELRKKANIQ